MPSDFIIPPPPTLAPGSTVWAYLRDSGGSGQDRSIEQQRAIIHEYCTQHGLKLLRPPFEDLHQSGKSTEGRSLFDQMISLSGSHTEKPTGLLIWNFARFARNLEDSQIFKSILRKRGFIIHSLTDNIPEGPYAAVIETLIHVADEHKRNEAAAGAWRGLHAIVRQGAVPGTPPVGFYRKPMTVISEQGVERTAHRWVPDPEIVPRVQQAFAMRAAGASLASIKEATRLYADLNTYTTFFRNQIYIGTLVYGEEQYPNYCEPIIDMATWQTVQKLAREHANRQHLHSKGVNHPRRKNSSYLLAGLTYCARCGAPLYGHNSPNKKGINRAYRCTRGKRTRDCDLPGIPAYSLETTILEALDELGNNPQYIDQMHTIALQHSQGSASETDNQRKQISTDLKAIRARLTRLASAIADGGHTRSILDLNQTLEAERDDLERKLSNLDEQKTANQPPASPEQIRAMLLAIRPAIEAATLSESQNILRGIIARLVVDRIDKELFIGIDVRIPKKKDSPSPDIIGVSTFGIPLGAQVYRHTIIGTVKQKPRSK